MIRPSPIELTIGDLGSTVVLSPHPDDESLAVGATLAALVRNGNDVRVLLATGGERSHPTKPPEQVRRVRAAEFAGALLRGSSIARSGSRSWTTQGPEVFTEERP